MERINKILSSAAYRGAIKATRQAELGRIYCLHGLEHAVDTARISYIIALENGYNIKKDVIYAAALLHDAGRFMQYSGGIPHHEASAAIAAEILPQCGFDDEETAEIIGAINAHRGGGAESTLGRLLYRADSLSRLCFDCGARETCKWSEDEMNGGLVC